MSERTYTPLELYDELDAIVTNGIRDSVLIMGESGVGKSQIVEQVCGKHNFGLWDVRWGQLAPVDARGAPAIDRERKVTEFYPPSFWPRKGPGVIFLDEFNMASTTMMGLGQQLLLNFKFGDYVVPDDVLVWAAGNRKVDRASVNEIPSPVKNRVAHYEVEHDFPSWKLWAFSTGIDSRIIGFLEWRPELLHKFNPDLESYAWPSPRTWEMADRRLKVGMSVEPVIGPCSHEFGAYVAMAEELPKISLIAQGKGLGLKFPEEPSMKFACVSGLINHALVDWTTYTNCFKWLAKTCSEEPEWVQSFVMDVIRVLQRGDKRKAAQYMEGLNSMPEASRFVSEYVGAIVAVKR